MEEFTRIMQQPHRPFERWSSRWHFGRFRGPISAHQRGILMMLASGFLFALMFSIPKLAGGEVNGLQVTFIRYFTGFLTILPIMLWRVSRGGSFRAPAWPLIALRASFGAAGVTCVIYATTHMTYADALAISFADGIFVLVLAMLILGERVSPRRWAAAALSLAGAVIVAQPSPELLGRVFMEPAAGIAFLGAAIMAGEVIVIKHLSHRLGAVTLLFYTNMFAVALLTVPAFYIGDWPPLEDLMLYALMGPVAIAGQFLFIFALRSTDVSALVPYKYSTLIYAVLLGIVFFGQWPDMLTVAGIGLIIFSGVQLSRLEARA